MLSSGNAPSITEAPKPHHVTDTAVQEWAAGRLRTAPYSALQNLSCRYQDGTLVLRGQLASYYLKQLAQAIVAQVAGIERIENHIEVPPVYASSLSFSMVEEEREQPIMVDGSRKRRTNGEARRAWYAKWRSIRFARHVNNC
jgi:hypothetical protein